METYFSPGMPLGFSLVKTDELQATMQLMDGLKQQNVEMAADMKRMGEHLDQLMDLYGKTVHLVRSVKGICKKILPSLNAHKYSTAKGELKSADELCAYILNAADEAQFALEEITDTWAFMTD